MSGVGIDMQQASVAFDEVQQIRSSLRTRLIGLDPLIDRLLIALLTGGHLLIEGAPGLAKTRTVRCFAQMLDVSFVRIQATPDLLPADITGTDIFQPQSGDFRFSAGPLFNNVILIDEVNRAPPKVQSALLEAMGERQITTNGHTRQLQQPFLVAATQNPIEHEGTYPLPEAQLDRFMFFITIDLPGPARERQILDQVLREPTTFVQSDTGVKPANANIVHEANRSLTTVHLSEAICDYIVRLTCATRGIGAGGAAADAIALAASPRASINMALASRASAWLDGRDFVTPDDVAALAPDILAGRLALDYRARAAGRTAREIVNEILQNTPYT